MVMKRKRGYTLAELLVVINIVLILSFARISLYNAVKNQIQYLKVKTSLYEISNSLSYIKYYCRSNKVNGRVKVDKNNKRIILYKVVNGTEVLKTRTIPNFIEFLANLELSVTNTGQIQSESIRLKDDNGNQYRISISTGIDTINVYEGE